MSLQDGEADAAALFALRFSLVHADAAADHLVPPSFNLSRSVPTSHSLGRLALFLRRTSQILPGREELSFILVQRRRPFPSTSSQIACFPSEPSTTLACDRLRPFVSARFLLPSFSVSSHSPAHGARALLLDFHLLGRLLVRVRLRVGAGDAPAAGMLPSLP